jgi:DNA topoisomerase I
MAKALIIVESPAKTKTLKNFLGDNYQIEASMGHVRDLPEKRLGVDVEHDFAPTYEALKDRGDVLKRLTAAAKGADTVYLASDPDREGEAISWHLAEALKLKNPKRIQFNEITRNAVQQALANPRTINEDLVDSQQARRILDRLVGYKLSPVLWKKIQKGLSAGRVQSVAVRLICEREREILAFVPEEYWSLTANLSPQAPEKPFAFAARLTGRGGEKLEPKSQADIDGILEAINGANYRVAEVKKREQKRNPSPPFITSTLQQEASRKLGFGNRRTMSVAQDLYEGVDLGTQGSVGLITYMRTDSVRVSTEAQAEARTYIANRYGENYVPVVPRVYQTKGAAQDAHEAIRPTSAMRDPEVVAPFLNQDQLRLYRLIWQRFIASQMTHALMDVTSVDIDAASATGAPYNFRATGSVMKFDGFMRIYTEGKDTEEVADDERPPLPPLNAGQGLDLLGLDPKQHFTEPPPRFTEATFVKCLEELNLGRPSTYASIIQVIREREYVELKDKRFYPTELGFTVTDQLVKHFPSIMDVKFTASMEDKLDEVESGHVNWIALLNEFYGPFSEQLQLANEQMEDLRPKAVETEICCPNTGKPMLLRKGRFGPFLGCSGFPECRKILNLNADGTPVEGLDFQCGLLPKEEKEPTDPSSLPNATEHVCPDGKGVMLVRQGRYGPFLGCSNYPKCRTTLKITSGGELLPDQEFKCTWSEEAAKASGRKSAASGTRAKAKTTKATTTKKTAAKTTSSAATTRSRAKKTEE